jgi:hypothetical protein
VIALQASEQSNSNKIRLIYLDNIIMSSTHLDIPSQAISIAPAVVPAPVPAPDPPVVRAAQEATKCSVRGCCLNSTSALLFPCASSSCKKKVHDVCYRGLIGVKFKLDLLLDGEEDLRVCTKKCYNVVQKTQFGSERTLWTRDGPGGPHDSVNSQSLLIDWMTTGSNFSRFRGNNEGKTKLAICEEIAAVLKEKKIIIERPAKQILDKIHSIEKSFKAAHDWINHTGQGVDDREQFREAVLKRCLYYYELEATMGDRAANQALVTLRMIHWMMIRRRRWRK